MSDDLNDVFKLLEVAVKLSKSAGNEYNAATKYFEAAHLLRRHVGCLPPTSDNLKKKELLNDKIMHYTKVARDLLERANSVEESTTPTAYATPVNDPNFVSVSPRAQLSGMDDLLPVAVATPVQPRLPAFQRFFTNTKTVNSSASKANTTLSHAIELDESGKTKAAIEAYMKCSQLYLAIIRDLDDSGDAMMKQRLVGRLEGAMDRVETLKLKGHSATRLQKAADDDSTSSASSLSQREIDVLKRSSLIASGVFLPWSKTDALKLDRSAQASIANGTKKPYSDPAGVLKLSPKQGKRFHGWARPHEIVAIRQRHGTKQQPPTMIRHISPYTIRQQYVTDCSFIASLCICATGINRQRLITSIIHPQDKHGQPIYNPDGKYMVKLWLNGVARQVVVDDRLPIDSHGNLLCSITKGSKHQLELWVPIIEKAYMKLCGGYDFPGSNSGIDLFALTGWIPERIFFPSDPPKLKDFETEPGRAWDRLYSANSFGDCLITVSTTPDMSESQADSLGLVTGHAYAVLNVFQSRNGVKLLQVKNPWASKSWKGKYSCYDITNWNHLGLSREIGYDPVEAQKHDDGVFWMEWGDVLAHFQNVQLSWNPALFPFQVSTHQLWEKDRGTPEDSFDIGDNPQYIIAFGDAAIKKKATVWMLLSRHVTKQEQQGCEVDEFLTMHLVRNSSKRERIWLGQDRRMVVHGAYTNNSHVLACYDIKGPEDAFMSIVLSQYQKKNDMGYTISVFCTESFTLVQPRPELQIVHDVTGYWTHQSAGGPTGQTNFFNNPMYLIEVKNGDTELQARCSTSKVLPVHLMMVKIPDKGKQDVKGAVMRNSKLIAESGSYRHAFTTTDRVKLQVGCYVLAVSNYHQGETGTFDLKICSDKPVQVAVIQ